MIHDPDERADRLAGHIQRYKDGDIGSITFKAFVVRDGGLTPSQAQELADEHRPPKFKSFAI